MGSPYKDLNDEERDLLQRKINMIHEFFIEEVANNRNMSVEQVRNISTGEFFLGVEAKELGLVDEFGDKDKAIKDMKKELNLTKVTIVEKAIKKSFLDVLLSNVAYDFGRGFATTLVNINVENRLKINA